MQLKGKEKNRTKDLGQCACGTTAFFFFFFTCNALAAISLSMLRLLSLRFAPFVTPHRLARIFFFHLIVNKVPGFVF